MTLATLFYATTGSNTAASGSNAPATAVTGTNGDISGTTFTLNETVDFTGVNDDGTDILWAALNSGDRHLFRITSFNPSVAAATSLTLSETATAVRTASNWAVGGKRADYMNDTSQPDFEDGLSGWEFEFAVGTYNQSGSVVLATTDLTDGYLIIRAESGAAVTFDMLTGATSFDATAAAVRVENIKFDGTSSGRTNAHITVGPKHHVEGCEFTGNAGHGIFCQAGHVGNIINNHIHNLTASAGNAIGIEIDNGTPGMMVYGNSIHDNTGDGIHIDTSQFTQESLCIAHNIIYDNGGAGIEARNWFDVAGTNNHGLWLINNTIHANTGAGIDVAYTGTLNPNSVLNLINNAVTDNGDHGVKSTTDLSDHNIGINLYNNYNGNTTNHWENPGTGASSHRDRDWETN